jgi:hypothetical protein
LARPHERKAGNLFWSAMTSMSIKADKACRCCGRAFAGGVSRINIHLLGREAGQGVAECTFVNNDPQIQSEFLKIKAEAKRRWDEKLVRSSSNLNLMSK